jgi:hypothetical protein
VGNEDLINGALERLLIVKLELRGDQLCILGAVFIQSN